MKDYQHYERLVESIVDSVKDNQDACASIFNALNGWVKFDVPGLKKIPRREETLKEEIDMAISSYSNGELTHHIEIARQHIYSLEKNGSTDVDNHKEQKDWLQLLLTEWERRHGVKLADNREEILAEEIAEYTDARLNGELNIVDEKLRKIKEKGMLSFEIEQEHDDLNDWRQLIVAEFNSRHNH